MFSIDCYAHFCPFVWLGILRHCWVSLRFQKKSFLLESGARGATVLGVDSRRMLQAGCWNVLVKHFLTRHLMYLLVHPFVCCDVGVPLFHKTSSFLDPTVAIDICFYSVAFSRYRLQFPNIQSCYYFNRPRTFCVPLRWFVSTGGFQLPDASLAPEECWSKPVVNLALLSGCKAEICDVDGSIDFDHKFLRQTGQAPQWPCSLLFSPRQRTFLCQVNTCIQSRCLRQKKVGCPFNWKKPSSMYSWEKNWTSWRVGSAEKQSRIFPNRAEECNSAKKVANIEEKIADVSKNVWSFSHPKHLICSKVLKWFI